ncbi:MAG: small subunit ribosomal protein [Candidatus Woesearchaeota archaeon]|nr:small subunit ribosomal protein [Candidatus Woesearchaeota archaeon]
MSEKIVHSSGKRKMAIARATLKKGKGNVLINHKPLGEFKTEMYRMKIEEPLIIAGDKASKIDIDVNVFGGGISGQAQAIRLAIARGLVEYFQNDKSIKEALEDYDRTLLVADVRRKETRKPNRSKARAKRQKSYR